MLYQKFIKFKDFLGPEVWKLFLTSVLVGVLWFGVESSFIFVLQGFLRAVGLVEAESTFLPDFFPSGVFAALIILLIFGLIRALVLALKEFFSNITHQAFVRTQRERLLHYSLFNSSNISSYLILNIFNERVPEAAKVIQLLGTLINTSVAAVLFFALGLKLAPIELLVGIILLLLLFFPLTLINKKIINLGKGLVTQSKRLTQVLVEGLKNNFLLKIYNLNEKEVKKGSLATRSYESYFKKYALMSSLKNAFPQFAGSIVVTIICFVSIAVLDTPSMKLVSFIYIFMRLAQALSEGSTTLNSVRVNLENFKDLYHWHLLCNEFEVEESTLLKDKKELSAAKISKEGINIEFRDVYFSYSDGKELFSGLNLIISTGDVLLVKGKSGSGKSTLLTLLLGLQRPKTGSILLNGQRVDQVRESLAPYIAYVGPEAYLIEGTIRENLLYGNDGFSFTDEDFFTVLRQAQLDDMIKYFPLGLDHKLSEETELSTGQKQRLSLARALLRKPNLLVLDEATANLDQFTEKQIVDVIDSISPKLTTVIISHKNAFDGIATKTLNMETLKIFAYE